MSTENIGGSWTHIGPNDWYIDAVAMGTFLTGDPRSSRGVGARMDAQAITGGRLSILANAITLN